MLISVKTRGLCPFKFNIFIVNAIEQYHYSFIIHRFYLGANIFHKSYLKCHNEDVKYKAAIARYIFNQNPSTPAQLQKCVTKAKYHMSVEKK